MKNPTYYTEEQMDEVLEFIQKCFGNGEECLVGHEIESEYVHTDVAVVTTDEGCRCFATFGMGAREMASPIPHLARAELVMFATEEMKVTGEEALVIASELQGMSKLPFENDTWLGPGHTVPASSRFCDTFGFDAFALDVIAASNFQDLGKVLFLAAIPIYKGELKAMRKRNSLVVLEQLEEEFGVGMYFADSYRMELKL